MSLIFSRPGVRGQLRETGIDLGRLNELDGDELTDALRELWVEVESEDGDTVRGCCG